MSIRIQTGAATWASVRVRWSSFARAYPAVIQQAEALDDESAAVLILQYVDTAVQVSLERIAIVLFLDLNLLRRAADRLIDQGALEALPGNPSASLRLKPSG